MKKILILLILPFTLMTSIVAQKVEIAYAFPFSEKLPFYEYYDLNEGGPCGIHIEIVEGSTYYIQDWASGKFYRCEKNLSPVLYQKDHAYVNLKNSRLTFSEYHLFYKYTQEIVWSETDIFEFNGIINGKKVSFTDRVNIDPDNYNFYFTGNILFIESKQAHQMESIEFLSDGSYKIRNASETDAWLKSGKGEELGWSQKFNKRNGKVSSNYFGDVNLSTVTEFYKPSCFDNAHDDEIIGAAFDALWDSRYNNFAKDSKGLIYFRKLDTDDGPYKPGAPANNIKFDIAILDPWTKQVKYYEDYAPNEYNPPRNADGIIIGSYSWTVAPDGNIYFTDADAEKGEYQIKRVINRWWDDMGINDRIIGQMNTNHIPLLTTMNGSQNDGYCFENDFVWVTEQSKDKKWSKIKKIDGREGWVETKYIDINDIVPITNASR